MLLCEPSDRWIAHAVWRAVSVCCGAVLSYFPRFRPSGRYGPEAAITVLGCEVIHVAGCENEVDRRFSRSLLAAQAMAVLSQGLRRGLFAARALMPHVRDVERLIGDSAEALLGFRGEVEASHFAPRWLLSAVVRAFASAGLWPRGHSRREGGRRPARKLNFAGSCVAAVFRLGDCIASSKL